MDVKPPKAINDVTNRGHDNQDEFDAEEGTDDGPTEATSIRTSLKKSTRGLSKYGPWGYLILGMLLCGGTLLLCVLWGMYFIILLKLIDLK